MKRSKLIAGVFKSVVPEFTAGPWSVGYLGHEDNTDYLTYPGFKITGIRNIDDQTVPGTTELVTNDVYVAYEYDGPVTGEMSIYAYSPCP